MKQLRYFIEFLLIKLFFLIFKLIGYKNASNLGAKLGSILGPFFRSRKLIRNNLKNSFPNITDREINILIKNMWRNYGRIFSDYVFIDQFRSKKLQKYIVINGIEILEKIKNEGKPVIFISGHFNNFELMAMKN